MLYSIRQQQSLFDPAIHDSTMSKQFKLIVVNKPVTFKPQSPLDWMLCVLSQVVDIRHL